MKKEKAWKIVLGCLGVVIVCLVIAIIVVKSGMENIEYMEFTEDSIEGENEEFEVVNDIDDTILVEVDSETIDYSLPAAFGIEEDEE